MSANPAIAAAKEDAGPNHCLACDAPLPPRKPGAVGRNAIVCRNPECIRTYGEIWRIGRAELRKARAQREEQAQADAERAAAPRCLACGRLSDVPHAPRCALAGVAL